MENETYKVAKELLDEFASETEKRQLNVSKNGTKIECSTYIHIRLACQKSCDEYNSQKQINVRNIKDSQGNSTRKRASKATS